MESGSSHTDRFQEVEMPPVDEFCQQGQDGLFYCTWKSKGKPKEKCSTGWKTRSDFRRVHTSIYPASPRANLQCRKHLKRHIMPVLCPEGDICSKRTAEQRDMKRHVQTEHQDYARRNGFPRIVTRCQYCDAAKVREDNRARHERGCLKRPRT